MQFDKQYLFIDKQCQTGCFLRKSQRCPLYQCRNLQQQNAVLLPVDHSLRYRPSSLASSVGVSLVISQPRKPLFCHTEGFFLLRWCLTLPVSIPVKPPLPFWRVPSLFLLSSVLHQHCSCNGLTFTRFSKFKASQKSSKFRTGNHSTAASSVFEHFFAF